jgi:hypothetical protein
MGRDTGVQILARKTIILFVMVSRPVLGRSTGRRRTFPSRLKQAGRKADHSSPFSVEVKCMELSLQCPYVVLSWCSIKRKDFFAFKKCVDLYTIDLHSELYVPTPSSLLIIAVKTKYKLTLWCHVSLYL